MKFAVPHTGPGIYESPLFTPISEHPETSDGVFSDGASCMSCSLSPAYLLLTDYAATKASENFNLEEKEPELNRLNGASGLRRRKRRKVRGYISDDDCYDDDAGYSGSSCSESPAPPTPQDEYFPPIPDDEDSGYGGTCGDDESEVVFWPRILPMQVDQMSVMSVQASLSFAEACLDRYAPYHELREADEEGDCEKAEKVLGRLLTEWYVVGASVSCHVAPRIDTVRKLTLPVSNCYSSWLWRGSTRPCLGSGPTRCSRWLASPAVWFPSVASRRRLGSSAMRGSLFSTAVRTRRSSSYVPS